ncbi:MAG TPA: hypothetical protein QF901_10615, partial [Gammaproteobacteria bacterium]|nr:hypothetical protein [Gammaproteobacteria bacterium]
MQGACDGALVFNHEDLLACHCHSCYLMDRLVLRKLSGRVEILRRPTYILQESLRKAELKMTNSLSLHIAPASREPAEFAANVGAGLEG